jgi:hypothetical protein
VMNSVGSLELYVSDWNIFHVTHLELEK